MRFLEFGTNSNGTLTKVVGIWEKPAMPIKIRFWGEKK